MGNLFQYQEKKYGNYIKYLAKIKRNLISALIQYYGSEYSEVINHVVNTLPVYFYGTNEDNDLIYKELNLNIDENNVAASGAFCPNFYIGANGKIHMMPFIKIDVRFKKNRLIPTLVHEYIHAIMSYKKARIVSSGFLEYKTGFMIDFYYVNPVDSKDLVFDGRKYNDLEEGLTEYDTEQVVGLLNVANPDLTSGYINYVNYVATVMDNKKIRKIINQCRLESDDFMYKFTNIQNGPIIRNILMGFKNKYEEMLSILMQMEEEKGNMISSVNTFSKQNKGKIYESLSNGYCMKLKEELNSLI